MTITKQALIRLAVMLLMLPCFGGATVNAAETYTPSVTVVLYAPATRSTAVEQTVMPVVGAQYQLVKLAAAGAVEPTFSPVVLTTNENGRGKIAGAAQLPRGHYRLTRVGAAAKPIAFTLPYTEDGRVKDDMVIYPKSNLALPDTGGASEGISGGTFDGDSQLRPGLPNTSGPDKILQTSGQIDQLPWWQLLLLGLGTLLVSEGLLLLKRKREEEEG